MVGRATIGANPIPCGSVTSEVFLVIVQSAKERRRSLYAFYVLQSIEASLLRPLLLQAEETLATSPTEDLLYQHPAQALLEDDEVSLLSYLLVTSSIE